MVPKSLARLRTGYRWPDPARGVAAVVCSALAGGWVVAGRLNVAGGLAIVCVFGVALVAFGVVTKKLLGSVVGVGFLAGGYLLSQVNEPISVVTPAALGTLLLLSVELAWWSAEMAVPSRWAPGVKGRRWAQLAAYLVGGFSLAVIAGLVGIAGLGAGSIVLLGGTACAVLLCVLLARTTRDISQH